MVLFGSYNLDIHKYGFSDLQTDSSFWLVKISIYFHDLLDLDTCFGSAHAFWKYFVFVFKYFSRVFDPCRLRWFGQVYNTAT